MEDARKSIVQFVNGCYEVADETMADDTKSTFLYSNRATFPFVSIIGLLHSFLYTCGEIDKLTSIKDRINKLKPYIEALSDGLNNLPESEVSPLTGALGQGAETIWLRAYQNIVNKAFPEYNPEELKLWKETRDEEIQNAGEDCKDEIRLIVQKLFFMKLQEVYGVNYEKNIAKLKNSCERRIIDQYGDEENFELTDYDWENFIELSEYKEIIEKNYSHDEFAQVFGIQLTDKDTSKKAKLAWFSLIESAKGKKKHTGLTQSDVNRLWLIHDHLAKYLPEEE